MESEQSKKYRSRLSIQIGEYFSKDEIRHLCLKLGVEPEDLPDDMRQDFARELTGICYRRGKLQNLVDECRSQRSHVAWPDPPIEETDLDRVVVATPQDNNQKHQETAAATSHMDVEPSPDQELPRYELSILLSGIVIGVIVAGTIALTWYVLSSNFQPGLEQYLEPIAEYSFDDSSKEIPVHSHNPQSQVQRGLSFVETDRSSWAINMLLDLPKSNPGSDLVDYAGSVCAPVDIEKTIDAVSAIVRAPQGANSLYAIFWTWDGAENYLSSRTQLEQDKWTPVFWGTKFGHTLNTIDTADDQVNWIEWNGMGIDKVCLWIASEQPFQGSVQIDDFVIYQTKPIID